MMINRRSFIASLSLLPAALARAAEQLPANRNIKWAVSSALWNYFPPIPFTGVLDVMKETGSPGIRLAWTAKSVRGEGAVYCSLALASAALC
jgi:hypothetical protein